jgi:hypothetical protein
LLGLAFHERITLVVSREALEDLARRLGPEPPAEEPVGPDVEEDLLYYLRPEEPLPPLQLLEAAYGGVVLAEPPAWVRRAVAAVVPEPAVPAVAAGLHGNAAYLVSATTRSTC